MREILFRGKTTRTKLWVYGHYSTNYGTGNTEIRDKAECCFVEVIPETVGQYTGLTVPSGKIFENDIVTAKFKSNGARYNFTVKYDNTKGSFVFDNGSIKVPFCDIRSVRIIGNIHDNPELLKGE